MLARELLRARLAEMPHLLRGRTYEPSALDRWGALDAERRRLLTGVDALRAERNKVSAEVGKKRKAGEDAAAEQERGKALGEEIASAEKRLLSIEEEFGEIEKTLPNVPDESVPEGEDETGNVVVKTWGTPRAFDFPPKAHWDLGPSLGILDFERAAKVTGARFTVLSGGASLLNRALIAFMMDLHTREHGYREVLPPFLVNGASLFGTGQLPKFAADLFRLAEPPDWYLIPTAEVPVTNLHRDEILKEADLPVSYCAYTPCFRAEAGAAGKDTRGLIRQHQFDKVELVKFSLPERSYEDHEKLTGDAEAVLERLSLPYRRVLLCRGDMGFASAKTYDLEVWLPGQSAYREISSCSNFEAFQARRAGIRVRREAGGKARNELLHTLNGSGLAVGRTLVAILENYQRPDGSVEVPQALRPYCGGRTEITG
ncbi:serine--tRNA ligase [Acidobacteria bacterium ACD]|nr:MAG: serine--tRNA ligase [Acidobacteriota bacterium]MCE7957902.1 serine--tRNA ligase [Acidobacteria bacterium ACB2]MDL1948597.1 serine--tRNA ligase [Acidobacteria bacterium ACD]